MFYSIKFFCVNGGLSQQKFSLIVGVSQTQINRIIKKKRI
ncbi:helix-turn-helix transcriptional regulator [Sulfurimonas sp. MAG313]|nr:helix-turn-helix transcriptional regulator [Sulfurimonas sp. MAG313]